MHRSAGAGKVRGRAALFTLIIVAAFLCVSLISALPLPQGLSPIATASGASGTEYNILNEQCDLYVTKSGGGHIEYLITVQNLGPTLKVLDIRMPNSRYSLDSAKASINGMSISSDKITDSDKVTGIHLDFGSNAIQTNNVGTIYLKIWDPVIAIKDEQYGGYAAITLTPAWFPSGENDLTTILALSIHLPQNISTTEIFVKGEHYTDIGPDALDRTTAHWEYSNVRWSEKAPNTRMGITVPDKYVEANSKFWSVTVLGDMGAYLVVIIIVAVLLIGGMAVGAYFIGKRLGSKPAYKRPLIIKEVSLIDNSLTPSTFAYLSRYKPQKVLTLHLLESAKAGTVKASMSGGLRLETLREDKKETFTRLSGGQPTPETVSAYFEDLAKGLKAKGASFDLNKGLDGFGPRVVLGWEALRGAKGALPEVQAMSRNIIWLLADEEFDSKWKEFARDRKELTIPLWLYRLTFDRPSDWVKGMGLPKDVGFADLVKEHGGPRGVTVRMKELTKGITGLTDRIGGVFMDRDKIKDVLSKAPEFEARSKRKPNVASLPASNKGVYQRFGGGV